MPVFTKFTENSATALLKGDCFTAKHISIIITCEHGGNRFPKRFSTLFDQSSELLESHRGYDPGALSLAKRLSKGLKTPLYFSTVTRLLVDLNRSPHNPKRFSEVTNRLSVPEKAVIQGRFYHPYRDKVQSALFGHLKKGGQVLHLSVHTFTPLLYGKVRNTDLGLLYDPSRKTEAAFCVLWQRILHQSGPGVQTRRNYPYHGTSDGFTTYLRKLFSEDVYMGVELEVNQKFLSGDRTVWLNLQRMILKSLDTARNVYGTKWQQ
jgi:predicted N-formylglutamate amidohydrolase